MIIKQLVAVLLVASLCVLIPMKRADAVKPSIGLSMFMGIYIQCNDGDGYPFTELLVGKDIPASELYSRTKSSYSVEKCIYEKTRYAVTFPNSIDNRNYPFHTASRNKQVGHPPLQVIANLNAMVKDGTIEMSPSVQKQLSGVYEQLDNDGAQISAKIQGSVDEAIRGSDVTTDDLSGINKDATDPSGANDSVKPGKKKKYIYVPSK